MKKRLYNLLSVCTTEEEIKSEFIKFFKLKLFTKHRFDHYSHQVLFEFKNAQKLSNLSIKSKTIAQTLYYIRSLKYGKNICPVPPVICVVDRDEAFLFPTTEYNSFYTAKKNYDWDRAASLPCPNLVNDIKNFNFTKTIHIYQLKNEHEELQFIEIFKNINSIQTSFFDSDKKEINEDNFFEIYNYWFSFFGKYVENGHKASEYFISDIEKGKSIKVSDSEVAFNLGLDIFKSKNIPITDYNYFWNIYEKVDNSQTIFAIRQKIDRISEDYQRRFTGEFYTPVEFSSKALEYIERIVGTKWYEKDNWRLWDMSSGTGNLEFSLPSSALKNCYISTLLEDDANYCQRIFPTATCFQYDYLNDDVSFIENPSLKAFNINQKMPKNLQEDLANPEINWIIFINPPFATSNTVGQNTGKQSKDNVSMTSIKKLMDNEKLGEVSRELFSQFLYRISKEFKNRKAFLGLFSKIKYLNSNNDQLFRDKVFNYKFERGFLFSSENFHGNKGKFPVGFLVWRLDKNKTIESQEIELDVYNEYCEKFATKIIKNNKRNEFLSKWVERPPANIIMPPLKSAIEIGYKNKDVRNRVSENFLCSLMCKGNDFQNQNNTALLSAPYVSAGAYSVIPENFEKSMVIHTVRRLPKANWINDRDQFYQPNIDNLPSEFIYDCVIWSIFADSNNTVSINNVNYQNKSYIIVNNLFPFSLNEIKKWECSLSNISLQIASANEDRFLAKLLNNIKLSKESNLVLDIGKELYVLFYKNLNKIRWMDYKISLWDIGWWQIKSATKDCSFAQEQKSKLKRAHQELGNKILPQIYNYGFLPPDHKNLD